MSSGFCGYAGTTITPRSCYSAKVTIVRTGQGDAEDWRDETKQDRWSKNVVLSRLNDSDPPPAEQGRGIFFNSLLEQPLDVPDAGFETVDKDAGSPRGLLFVKGAWSDLKDHLGDLPWNTLDDTDQGWRTGLEDGSSYIAYSPADDLYWEIRFHYIKGGDESYFPWAYSYTRTCALKPSCPPEEPPTGPTLL
jgi:hypothetical protein